MLEVKEGHCFHCREKKLCAWIFGSNQTFICDACATIIILAIKLKESEAS